MPKKSKPRYVGILSEPLYVEDFAAPQMLVESDESFSKRRAQEKLEHVEALFERITALYAHYGLVLGDPGADAALVRSMASAHVPGFQWQNRKPQPGRPKKWDAIKLTQLWATYDGIRPRFNSDKSTLEHIARSEKYKKLTGGAGYERLKELLRDAKDPKKNPLAELLMSIDKNISESNRTKIGNVREWYLESFLQYKPIPTDRE